MFRRKLTDTGAALMVIVTACAVAAILLFMPRFVPPTETPGLRLDPDAVRDVLRADRALAARAPTGEVGEELERLYVQHSVAEGTQQPTGSTRERARALTAAVARLRAVAGDDALAAVRARALLELPQKLASTDAEEKRRFFGEFEEMLELYGVRRDGRDVAPPFVLRTLFKARWNAVANMPPTDGMADVELRAYWGWLALESTAPPVRRLEALEAYEQAGGARSAEARAALGYMVGAPLEAAEAFDEQYRQTGNVRLRNHALAALEAAR